MELRITTFNCENLFGRYRFLDEPPADKIKNYEKNLQTIETATLKPGRKGELQPAEINKEQRINTANAILGAKPDVLAVQEVESLAVLRLFNAKYMANHFDQIVLIDGNDARGIDVGFLIRKGVDAKIIGVRTHADESINHGFLCKTNRLDTSVTAQAVFSRDCLEVDVLAGGALLTFLVNHLKAQDAKKSSTDKRCRQATRVCKLAEVAREHDFHPIVLGDFNIDTRQENYDRSLEPFMTSAILHDPFSGLDDDSRWTHWYSSEKTVSRLDYILIDERLRDRVKGTDIFRQGLSKKCKQYAGPRLPSMKDNDLEASDHCPTTLALAL